MLHAHVQTFLQTLNMTCLLVRFPSFRYPEIKVYVNAEMTPKMRERSERAKNIVIWLCLSCLLWFLMKIEKFNKFIKKDVHNFLLIIQ